MTIKICEYCGKKYSKHDYLDYSTYCPNCQRKIIKGRKRVKLFIFLLLFIAALLIYGNLISASLGTFKVGSCVPIRVLSNCSGVNISEVSNNFETFNLSSKMSRLSGQTFNYTFCNTSLIGVYSYSWEDMCVDCSQGNCGNSFEITFSGTQLTISKAVTYILIFVIAFILFIGLLIAGIMIPSSNNRDEMTGYILAVSNIKYVKMFCWALAYLIAMFIAYFSWSVSASYLDLDFVTNILRITSWGMILGILPFFVLFCYFAITNYIRDSKLADMLSRGLHIKEL